MSWMSDAAAQIRKIMLMEHKLDQATRDIERVERDLTDHDRRLVRIETMIEMAQERTGQGARRIDRGA